MPIRQTHDMTTGEITLIEISETEARRERLGLPEGTPGFEINAAWDAFQTQQQQAATVRDQQQMILS